jgi:diguanylate cyclase (GGDEF)-like protein/PAS domain S-box-containing protein
VLGGLIFVQACRSLTQAETARQRLLTSELYYRALAANSSDAVVLVGADGRILTESPKLAELVGHAGNPTTGIKINLLVDREDVGIVEDLLAHAVAAPGVVFDDAVRVHHGAGGRRWIAARVINLLHDPAVGGIVANLRDVTDRKSAEERLAHQAYHDSLTGLANRTLFLQRVEQSLRRDSHDGSLSAVIFLDVDGFKTVNDSLGHEAGDQMLCEVAARLVRAVRGGDTVARLGGDEFAVLVERSAQPGADAASIAERILDVLAEPMTVDGLHISISASLGIAVSEPDSTASALLRSADIAMYQAKSEGKKRWVAYVPEMQVAAVERLQLEADLSEAVDTEQLRLVYQPVIDLETNRVAGLEALLRWDHPTLGTIAPARFIPIAEESGLIVPIGRWVLDTACEMAVEWQRFAPPGEAITMAVNVSGCQLVSRELIDDVQAALARSGLPADRLLLEMTETVMVRDAGSVAQQLRELRQLGVRLAIDDFGTGYSSLSYLRTFPVDILKLDRSFVSSVGDRTGLPAIVSGLLDLARTLGLEIVAEGIERPAQRNLLRDAHCPLGQGFLFARPLRPDDVAGYLTQVRASIRPAGMELADAN